MTPAVRRQNLHLDMLTPLDDPHLVRFLRSMPNCARRDICTRAVGTRCMMVFSVAFIPALLLLGLAGQWCGTYFGAESVGFLLGVVVGGGAMGLGFTIYRNRRLRELLVAESHDGLLTNCPVCIRHLTPDAQYVCECGCIVRPFQSNEN